MRHAMSAIQRHVKQCNKAHDTRRDENSQLTRKADSSLAKLVELIEHEHARVVGPATLT